MTITIIAFIVIYVLIREPVMDAFKESREYRQMMIRRRNVTSNNKESQS